MLEPVKIVQIAEAVAKSKLTAGVVEGAQAAAVIDSEGREALRITIVIKSGTAAKLNGDAVLDTLVQIQDRLRAAGEERFGIVEYATKAELEAGDDSES
ncbi:MAG TPA: hypothetical protein VNV39_15390 [Stellaceae bacterium]|jgi:hypothetical protein|nr:hypothetical protein [Stellaceae bacterium]